MTSIPRCALFGDGFGRGRDSRQAPFRHSGRLTGRLALQLACFALSLGVLRAAEPGESEADRLRAMLRDTTVQLRSAQSDLANLQAAQASLSQEKITLAAKYELAAKDLVAERTTNEKAIAELRADLAAQKEQVARLSDALTRAKTEGGRAVEAHLASETRYVRLTNEVYALQRRLADREKKNLTLFLIGNEILTRYEDFGLGRALAAKEPFVGKTRAKLENLVQDYQDRLLDQRAR